MAASLEPTYSWQATSAAALAEALDQQIVSVTMLPVAEFLFAASEGTVLDLSQAGVGEQLPVPVPRLAGLDDVEVERFDFDLASEPMTDEAVAAEGVTNGAVSLSYPAAAGAAVRLERIEIEDLSVAATGAQRWVLPGTGAGVSRVVFHDGEQQVGGATGGGKFLHFLVQPAGGGGFGPPAAAVPRFNMPGSGGSLYGPALGGATLEIFEQGSRLRAVIRFSPPLATASCRLMLARDDDASSAHGGLPNNVTAVDWSAQAVRAVVDVRPAGVSVTADAGTGEEPLVARFDSDPGERPVAVDFAPVARSLLRAAYPASQGDDLGLKLRFAADTPGKVRVHLRQVAARYLRRPLAGAGADVALRGAAQPVLLPVPEGLRPSGISFTADGRYGPARLAAAADVDPPVRPRHGFRLAGDVWLARRLPLTAAERDLPLARVALYGRASEEGELLVTLHRGDEVRIGAAVGEPCSLELAASPEAAWHRGELSAASSLPPHPQAFWLVARVTRGVFWWHTETALTDHRRAAGPRGDGAQRSIDAGGGWTAIAHRPLAQLAVLEVDAEGRPSPLEPLVLGWADGVLNADLVGVAGADLPPEFRRHWLVQGDAHRALLDRIPNLSGSLELTFTCRRDVDLTLRDAVLTYDPWQAGAG